MTSMKLTCQGAAARAEVSGVITAGLVGMTVTIECDGAWDGLIKTFVAMTAAGRQVVAITEGTATVPWEILTEGMRLFIGLEGRNVAGDIIIPTAWADCGRIKASTEGSHQGKPTPSEMEQLLTAAGDASQRSKEAKETAEAAKATAEDALGKSQYAYDQAKSFVQLHEDTEKAAQAAADAVGKMQYVSFEIDQSGDLLLKNPERLGSTSFRLDYETGELEVKL